MTTLQIQMLITRIDMWITQNQLLLEIIAFSVVIFLTVCLAICLNWRDKSK